MPSPNWSGPIRAGAELLDERIPGWEEQLDLDMLDLADCQKCILGQLYGHYSDGKEALGISMGDVHGFNDINARFRSLTSAWRRFVARRLTEQLKTRVGKYLR